MRGIPRRCRFSFHSHLMIFLMLLCKGVLSVVVTHVHLITKHGENDYVLHGEEATLRCLYQLEEMDEVLTSVEWFLNGEEVYLWQRDLPPKAKGALQGRVDLTNTSPKEIKIEKADMAMHGTYVCRMKTDLNVAENELDVIVIVDNCKESSWETYTDMIQCTETLSLHCVGMFPKPSPQCGVFNRVTQTYAISMPLDQATQLRNGTYEIRMNRRLPIKDWINYTDITFLCEIIVKETTWKKGIEHKLFGDRGCSANPPELEGGYYNLTDVDHTCWGNPRDGVLAKYTCLDQSLTAVPSTLVCRNSSWVAAVQRNNSWVVDEDQALPTCGARCLWSLHSCLLLFISIYGHLRALSSAKEI